VIGFEQPLELKWALVIFPMSLICRGQELARALSEGGFFRKQISLYLIEPDGRLTQRNRAGKKKE